MSLYNLLKKVAERMGLSDTIRWSPLFRFLRDFRHRKQRSLEIRHLAKVIKPHALCFDIGACMGSKTDILLRLKARRVVAVEPDPSSVATLKARYGRHPRVIIVNKATSDKVATETFHVQEQGSALNTLSKKWVSSLENAAVNRFAKIHPFIQEIPVTTTTLDCLIEQYGVPDVIKLDVEGYELQTLLGLSRKIPFLFFECNLPEFLEETLGCLDRLYRLDEATEFNYCIDTTDSPNVRFQLDHWVDFSQMSRLVRSTDSRFMEIYARTNS